VFPWSLSQNLTPGGGVDNSTRRQTLTMCAQKPESIGMTVEND